MTYFNKFSFVTVILLLSGCSDYDRGNITPTSNDAAIEECDPDDTMRLASDFDNCGACGNVCPQATTSRCHSGECRCGGNLPCNVDEVCKVGKCVTPDNDTLCDTDEDCFDRKECIPSIDNNSYCVEVCEFDDECAVGHYCVMGACTKVNCVPEECNNIDDDCDTRIDENSSSSGPLSQWCYSGEDISMINPPCKKGTQICDIGGMWSECRGEVPPVFESGLLTCDGIDNDCDTCIDGTYEDGRCVSVKPNGFDIVFLLDLSGSMSSTISAVKSAMEMFSTVYSGDPEYQFGIAVFPGEGEYERRTHIHSDLAGFVDFSDALDTIPTTTFIGSIEPNWDAVYETGTEELGFSWREGTIRLVILFTDEEGQSYRSARGLTNSSESSMCDSLTHGEALTVFNKSRYFEDFDECANLFEINDMAERMVSDLETIITDPCSR